MTPILHIQLFGKAALLDRDQALVKLPAKAQELFFYLLLYSNRPHERESLCEMLWPDQLPERTKKYLRQALWQLQKALNELDESADSLLDLDGNWVHLNLTPAIWLDAACLSDTYYQINHVPASNLTQLQVKQAQKAVSLYQGDLLTGWYQDWCILERERYQSMVLALLDQLIEQALYQGYYTDGIDYARQILQIDNARERTHRALMRLYALSDNRSAALRQYERCATVLRRELNVEPAKRTLELYQQIQTDQFEERWRTERVARMVTQFETQGSSPTSASLPQIHDLLATLQQDIVAIKHALQL